MRSLAYRKKANRHRTRPKDDVSFH